MKTKSIWQKNMQSIVDNDRGHKITIDLPPAKGGDDTGATALELAALGLPGCLTTIFAMIAKNSKLEFTKLEASCDVQTDEAGMNILSADCLVTVASQADKDLIERVFQKTLEACPVGNLFSKANIPMKEELKII